jgi:hypothetical protein
MEHGLDAREIAQEEARLREYRRGLGLDADAETIPEDREAQREG